MSRRFICALLFLLLVFVAPFSTKPAQADVSVTDNPKCEFFLGDIKNMTCEFTITGEASDNNRQVLVYIQDESGNLIQQQDCTIHFDTSGAFICKVTFGPIPTGDWKNVALIVKDKNTGKILFSFNKKDKGQNPCGPTGAACNTALGPISTKPQVFASKILALATGVAGGIALILMVIGSIRVLTSSGDQQKLSGGRDMIIAAVAGLLFLIFSVLILRFIGLEIFGTGILG